MNRQLSTRVFYAIVAFALVALAGCPGPTPTPSPTPPPTPVPPTATPLPSLTPTPAPTPSPTPLPLADWVAEGDAAQARSDLAAAEKAYLRAAEADPKYAPAQVGLARLYGWMTGREKDSLAAAQRATELDPKSAPAWSALSDAQRWRGDTPEALKSAEKAVQLDPKDARAQAALGRAYLSDRQYDAAMKAVEEAVKLEPDSASVHNALSRVHEGMSDFGRARAALEQAVALEPQFAPWRTNLGDLFAVLQRYDKAQEQYDQALKLAPDYPSALLGQAGIHSAKLEYAEAKKLMTKAATDNPEATEPLVRLGFLYLVQEEPEKAADKFAQAAKLDPEDWWLEANQAYVRMSEGDCESAAATYQNLSSAHSREGSLRLDSARAKWCLGDTDRALELVRGTTEMEPYNSDAYWMLAQLYASQQRWDEATGAYVQAARYAPVAAAAHSGLGDAYLDQNNLDAVEQEARLTTELDPNDRRGFAGLCIVYWYKNEPEQMLAPCEQAVKLDPKYADDRARRGVALAVNGRYKEAIDVLTQNVADNPEHPLSHLYLGLANLRLKQYDAAKKELETYQKITQDDEQRLGYLISGLDQGWELREAKALEYMKGTDPSASRSITWKVESTGQVTRTLAAAIKAKSGERPEELYQIALDGLAVASLFVPRWAPEINGGTVIRATDTAGKPLFALEVGTADQWNFLTRELSRGQFDEKVDFIQPTGGARTPEMTDKLVKTTGDDVTKLRGLTAKKAIPFERLKQAGLEEELKATIDEEDRQEARNDQLLMNLLGALDPKVNLLESEEDLMGEQTLGFYNTDDKTFHVVQDKAPGLSDRLTAAHEYLHALQDQAFDIGKAQDEEKNDDRRIAYDALVEGDAQLTTSLYAQEKLPALEMLETIEASSNEVEQDKLEQSPGVLRGWLEFPYNQGMVFVQGVHATGGWEAVNELFKNPPASTEQVLHPERYRAGEKPVEVTLPDLSKTLGTGWQVTHENVLGELTWRLALAELVGPASAERAADGWGGDRYTLLRQGEDGPGAVLMRTTWDTPEDAEEFWAVIRTGLAGRPEFGEVVHDLTGPALTRYFKGSDVFWILRLDGSNVTLAIGPTEEIAAKLNDTVK